MIKRGRGAVEWFASRGDEVHSHQPIHVRADVLRSPSFEIARVWHTPARVTRRVSGQASPGCRAVIQMEGETTWRSASLTEPVILSPGISLLMPTSTDIEVAADEPGGRIEIRTSRPIPRAADHEGIRLADGGGYRASLVAMINAALSSDLDPSNPGFNDVRIATEHLLSAMFRERQPPPAQESRQHSLYQDGLALIRREACDPRLTVDAVARRLSFSERTLRRAFAHHGTSVRAEIAQERARSAHAMISQRTPATSADLLLIASASGYTTLRAMRESLRRHGSESLDAASLQSLEDSDPVTANSFV